MRPLFIRADANKDIGTGHVMRCLALAQVWRSNNGEVVFITGCTNKMLLDKLHENGIQVIQLKNVYPHPDDLKKTTKIVEKSTKSWVVVDGYHFDSLYHRRIKECGNWLMVIDDMSHIGHYYVDIVLNQNIHAEKMKYSCEPFTRLLLGTRYALLRNEFWSWKSWNREIPETAKKILVTFGGSDPENQTLKVIRALQLLAPLNVETIIVAGASNPNLKSLETAIKNTNADIQLVHNAANMPELMAWADIAVSASGSTCWELSYMGLPTVLIVLADNQQDIATELSEQRAMINLGWHEKVNVDNIAQALSSLAHNHDRRLMMSDCLKKLVDRSGNDRVFSALQSFCTTN